MKRLVLLLVLLLPASGSLSCSWIFVKPLPPDYQRGDRADCTTSVGAPVADTLLAGSNIAGVLYIAGTSNGKTTSATNALVTSALIWTGIYIGSAVHGYRATAACRDVMVDGADDAPRYPRPRIYSRPLPPPPASLPSAGPPEPPPVEPAPAGPVQQQDDDDPGRLPPPRKPAPIQPKPDAPRFGG